MGRERRGCGGYGSGGARGRPNQFKETEYAGYDRCWQEDRGEGEGVELEKVNKSLDSSCCSIKANEIPPCRGERSLMRLG